MSDDAGSSIPSMGFVRERAGVAGPLGDGAGNTAACRGLSRSQSAAFEPALAVVLGWFSLGVVKALLVNVVGTATARPSVRALHHAVELGRHLGVGVAVAIGVYCWSRVGPRSPVARVVALLVVALSFGGAFLAEDLTGLAERTANGWAGVSPSRTLVLIVVAIAVGVTALLELLLRCRFGLALIVPAAVALALAYLDSTVSPMANPAAHFFLSWLTATCLYAFWRPSARRAVERLAASGRAVVRAAPAFGIWVLWALAAPQRHSVQIDIARWPSNLNALRVAVLPGVRALGVGRTDVSNPFFAAREGRRDTPPSPSVALPAHSLVFLISIDSLRADVFRDEADAAHMPTISRLRDAGVAFETARSPGSQTVVTLAGLSTGRYFSQQYWTRHDEDYVYWMTEDRSRHFANELLVGGVTTAALPTAHWMENRWGLLRGFKVSEFDPALQRWSEGDEITDRILAVLDEHSSGPLVVFTHYLDSHAPFRRGGTEGPPRERYLRSLGFVDSQVARIVEAVEARGLIERSLFIITGDHGEAFGEHNMYFHGNTLYDELIRVPLIFSGAGLAPARISTPVSLVDVGPTVLDLFGLPTASSFMGQSLVPLLRGEPMTFDRPIVAEGLLRQAMIFDDGYKVIRDQRDDTVEIYNLATDPGEAHNLSDDVDLSTEEHLLALDHFFEVHTYRAGGYTPPLRK